MGAKYTVNVWTLNHYNMQHIEVTVYQGNNLIKAINAMRKARRNGVGRISLEWR